MLCAVASEERRARLDRVHSTILKDHIALGLLRPGCYTDNLHELLEVASGHHFAIVVVDLQVYEQTPAPITTSGPDRRAVLIRSLKTLHPSTIMVLLSAKDRASVTVAGVVGAAGFDFVIAYEDMLKPDVWFGLLRAYSGNLLQHQVRADFQEAVKESAVVVPARDYVELVLERAPWHTDVRSLVTGLTHAGSTISVDRLTKVLARQRQLPPRALLFTFRMVFYARLRQEKWNKAKIANFLTHPDTRALNRCINRTYGVSAADLDAVPYQDTITWAVDQTGKERVGGRAPQARELIRRLLKAA